jgi:hypothetical protein
MDKETTVYFYDYVTELTKQEDICLNNFEISEFKDEKGLTFLTNEHYYQAHKFESCNIKDEFKHSFEEKFLAAFEEIRLFILLKIDFLPIHLSVKKLQGNSKVNLKMNGIKKNGIMVIRII